jgi:hypothetical protein
MVPVEYVQYDSLSHISSAAPWLAWATARLFARFFGSPLPRDSGHIAPGNSLAPID